MKSGKQTVLTLKLGINDCNNFEYHSDRTYLSSTVIKTIHKSLDQYHREYILGDKPEIKNVAALQEGSLCHTMLLEPHLVSEEYEFYPGLRKQGVDWETFVSNSTKNERSILSAPQRWKVEQLVAGVNKIKVARDLLSGGVPEQTICGVLDEVPVKVRFDYINVDKGYIADVKTTGYSGDLDSFRQTVKDLMYHLSAALYTKVAELHYGRPFDFYFIVASKKDFQGNVYKLSDENMQLGTRQISQALAKYKQAMKTGVWTELKSGQGQNLFVADANYEVKVV